MGFFDPFMVGIEQQGEEVAVFVSIARTTKPKRKLAKPQLVYLTKEASISLMKLGVLSKYKGDLYLKGLSIIELERVLVLLNELDITIPLEVRTFLSDLTFLMRKVEILNQKGLSLFKRKEIVKEIKSLSFKYNVEKRFVKFDVEQLNFAKKSSSTLQLDTLKLALFLRSKIYARIPNIYVLKLKERMKILELLDLVDKLDEE
jgi:hypothetical protein